MEFIFRWSDISLEVAHAGGTTNVTFSGNDPNLPHGGEKPVPSFPEADAILLFSYPYGFPHR